ncbi:DUF3313 domain-containing protein [Nguyenibacter vanlangensis]|uniref:DUF3313 domain-containing protein n=2 Tax=Nguyenibacter vanlangensis TaxID=1216886 RepID=A0A7Y7M750_9PROT|nr:DUF3313 domain-containing protein [Nguyenibacter vanlangensis]
MFIMKNKYRGYRDLCRYTLIVLGAFGGSAMLVGCTDDPRKYQNLQSSHQLSLQKSSEFKWQYLDPDADFSKYKSAMIDPVEIYRGSDAQFGSTSKNDRVYMANYIDKTFPKEIGKKYTLVHSADSRTLRFHVTLTGVKKSIPVLSTISHISSVGLVTNAGMQAAGGNGTAYGAVYYAVEVYDAQTSRLLYAQVTVQTPDALDPTVSFGYLDAAREGVRIGAHHLVQKLEKLSKQEHTTVVEKTGDIGEAKGARRGQGGA